MIKTKLVSSLEKPFADQSINDFAEYTCASALLGEKFSFQMLYTYELDEDNRAFLPHYFTISGSLAPYATIRHLKSVAVTKPIGIKCDDNYLRTAPGAYPDILFPENNDKGEFCASTNVLNSIFIDIDVPSDKAFAGKHQLKIEVFRKSNKEKKSEETFTLDVIGCELPEEKTLHTQWLSAELFAPYYGIEMWGERHWEITENAMAAARRSGVNMLFTPAFNLTVSEKTKDGWRFDYTNLDKWVSLGKKLGFTHFEMQHLFSAGDADWASAFKYFENGEEKSTKGLRATDPVYVDFIRTFLKEFIEHFRTLADPKRLVFHIADEPALKNIEKFRAAKETVIDIIGEYDIIDAIMDIEYFNEGLVTAPVPITDHIQPFIENNVPNLWTYYCTGPQAGGHSNRFITQSGECTRSIGMQLYKYNIVGFLHWALCYLGGGDTDGIVDPYLDQNGNNWVPAGDTGYIYPRANGEFYESIRGIYLRDAFQDIRAMQLLEKYTSHEAVVALIEGELGCELKFNTCAKSVKTMNNIRNRINEELRKFAN